MFLKFAFLHDDNGYFSMPAHLQRELFTGVSSLISLKLGINVEFSFPQLINLLAPLQQLIHLYLNLHFYDDDFSLAKFDHVPQHQIAQLSSVRVLILDLHIRLHSDVNSHHWSWAFPNVQIVEIIHFCENSFVYNCEEHGLLALMPKEQHPTKDQLAVSIRRLFQPFKQSPKLRRIYAEYLEE